MYIPGKTPGAGSAKMPLRQSSAQRQGARWLDS